MNITTTKRDGIVVLSLCGRLDTSTAPAFEKEVKTSIADAKELYLDLKNLDYIASSGLRVFLIAQKIMAKKGKMVVQNPNEMVREIFEVTGCVNVFTIA